MRHKTGLWVVLGLGLLAMAPGRAAILPLSNGTLHVDIESDNGAIRSARLGALEFFRVAPYVSDFGMQVSDITGTFAVNTAYGVDALNATAVLAASMATATGTFAVNSASLVGFERRYELVPGLNVLRVQSTLTNLTGSDLVISYFDTVDPDQVIGDTSNDVFELAGARVGEATDWFGPNNPAFLFGSQDLAAVVSSGDPAGGSAYGLAIDTGMELNGHFTSPFDPNGAFRDAGLAVGFRETLAPLTNRVFVVDYAFGATQAAARNDFIAANSPVPEPGTLSLLALGLVALRRRRRA